MSTATSGAYADSAPSPSNAGPTRAPSAAPATKPASGSALATSPRSKPIAASAITNRTMPTSTRLKRSAAEALHGERQISHRGAGKGTTLSAMDFGSYRGPGGGRNASGRTLVA